MDLNTRLLITLIIYIHGVCLGGDAVLSPGPVYGAVGGSVWINTTISPAAEPLRSVIWTFNGVPVVNSVSGSVDPGTAHAGRIHLDTFTGSLQLRDLTVSDSGDYVLAVRISGTDTVHRTTLQVFEKISGVSLTGPEEPLTENISSVVLTCEGTGPNITTEWMKDGQPLSPSNNVIFSADLRSVSISPVRRSDSGEYQCRLSNPVSSDTAAYTMTVYERISGVSLTGPTEPLIEDQSSANLTCEGTGSIITTEWMKDGQPLSPNNNIIFSADLRSVSISPVRGSDSGEYQCRLSNPVSSDTATYTMTVNYGPQNVAISGQNEVEVGSKVTLTCSAESTPPASFIWMLNGTETGETTASYSIEKIDSTHSGNYTCTAWNSVTSLNTTVHHHLTVTGRGGLSGGAIAGIIIGVIVVIGGVTGLVFYFMKFKNRSKAPSGKDKQGSNARHQEDKGETDVNYADVRVFRKANGEQVQLGNVGGANTVYSDVRGNTAANQRPPQVDYETQYSQIVRPRVQTSPGTYA